MWFQQADAFTLVQFRLECVSDISGLSDRIQIRLESVSNSEDWSFHDRIAVRPEKTHEVTRCKQAQREYAGKAYLLSLPQLTCVLSQAQQSFTSLINHMN